MDRTRNIYEPLKWTQDGRYCDCYSAGQNGSAFILYLTERWSVLPTVRMKTKSLPEHVCKRWQEWILRDNTI